MTRPDSALKAEVLSPPEGFREALPLRYEVFCDEQGVPREIEQDEEDAISVHVLVRGPAGEVVATGRVMRMRADGRCVAVDAEVKPGDVARIGRMAVRRDARGTGVGAFVLQVLEQEAARAGLGRAVLHAQTQAQGFYARSGYAPHGEVFEEAGIAHVEMHKAIGG